MQKKIPCFILWTAVLSWVACARVDYPEANLKLDPGETERLFTAEFLDNKSDTTAVVTVISNRSWFAVLNDLDQPVDPSDASQKVAWGTIDIDGHSNLTQLTDTVLVQVTISRNKTQVPVNGVLDFYSCGGKVASVKLNQSGAVYHLDATPEKIEADCKPDRIFVAVDCNTHWQAEIIDATAEVTLEGAQGYDPGTMEIKFAENSDVASAKTATVKISAKDCPDKILTFTQKQAVPYIDWAESMSDKIHGWEQSGKLIFLTNCAWTLEVTEGGLQNIVLEKTSGEAGIKGEQEVRFTFTNPATDPVAPSMAVFTLKTDYTDPISVTLSQRASLPLNLASQTLWAPALPTSSSTTESSHTFTYEGKEYTITMLLPMFDKNKLRFVGSNGTLNGYIKFPSIVDATLAGVEIHIKGNATYYRINAAIFTEDGQTQMSDAFDYAQASTSAVHLFILGQDDSNPSAGEVYMLKGLAKQTCCLNKIVLYYE